jgi:prepilin-type N-terminal cleavage/methylation domain-containing protein
MVVPGHSLQAAAVEGVTRLRSVGAASDSRHEQISTASGFLYGWNVRKGPMPARRGFTMLELVLAASLGAVIGPSIEVGHGSDLYRFPIRSTWGRLSVATHLCEF